MDKPILNKIMARQEQCENTISQLKTSSKTFHMSKIMWKDESEAFAER